jgi:hypothetical protein
MIHCDDEQMLERIHELFFKEEKGEIRYTMMKLVPIPPDSFNDEGKPLYGFFTPMGYWGTRSDFQIKNIKRNKDELIFEYWTANGSNLYWIEELIYTISEMLDESPDSSKPMIYIKHLYDICQVLFAGYMFWKPGMDMKYEYSTEDNPNQKVIYEYEVLSEEREKELEVLEFHIEDYLEEEPYDDDFDYRFQRYGWDIFNSDHENYLIKKYGYGKHL